MSYSENDSEEFKQIYNSINQLMTQMQQNEQDYASLKHRFEYLLIGIDQISSFNVQFEQNQSSYPPEQHARILQSKHQEETRLQNFLNEFKNLRIKFVKKFDDILKTVESILDEIINKQLFKWRENQVLVGNGSQPMDPNVLNKIQNWCENMARLLWNMRKQLKIVPMYCEQLNNEDQNIPDMLMELSSKVFNFLQVLVKQTVIVEAQPPQVLKTNTRFATTLRLLIGKALNITLINPSVVLSIVSEQQAQISQQFNQTTNLNSGDLLNCSGSIELNETTSRLAATFRSVQLKRIVRSEKKGAENVTDEKFGLLFQSHFSIGDGELIIYIAALSMPIVVIVHGNQEPQSHATILWDNAFSKLNRRPFDVKSLAEWNDLGDALRMKFCAPTHSTEAAPNAEIFTNNMLQCLCKKALRQFVQHDNMDQIYWAQFCKDPLPDRNFTFWEWFYAAMRLIREHMCDLWNKNYIIGFIDKASAENLLLTNCQPGTFLLRFSDSELGGLTIATLNLDENNIPYVFHIQPLTSKVLTFHSLPDRILDLVELKTLYPGIKKADAFGPYASHRGPPASGYVPIFVHASLPRPSGNENQEDSLKLNVNLSSMNSTTSASPPGTASSFNIQLPDFNIFLTEYEGTVMEMNWSNGNELPELTDPFFN